MTALPELPLDGSPYQRFLRLEMVSAEPGQVVIRLPFREEFLRADGSDWYHGGVVAALIDIAGDYALWSQLGQGLPTIDLRVDWLRPARRGALLALGKAVKVGRTVSTADVEVRDERGDLVAVGRGTYASPKP
ncbi:MAG: PaaI family thioesterase [Gemmatimonadales bacterium]